MPKNYISPISMDALSNLCSELDKNNWIKPKDYQKYHVKRGLRNEDGTGVMAGLTRICSVIFKCHLEFKVLTILRKCNSSGLIFRKCHKWSGKNKRCTEYKSADDCLVSFIIHFL